MCVWGDLIVASSESCAVPVQMRPWGELLTEGSLGLRRKWSGSKGQRQKWGNGNETETETKRKTPAPPTVSHGQADFLVEKINSHLRANQNATTYQGHRKFHPLTPPSLTNVKHK